MVSRTPEGKHTKRFIIERQLGDGSGRYTRSGDYPSFYETKGAAQEVIKANTNGCTYRVRQK
jgi:hypothetical protein